MSNKSKYLLPYPNSIKAYIHEVYNQTEKDKYLISALVLIPKKKSVEIIPEKYELFYKILALHSYYKNNSKKTNFNPEEELKNNLNVFLKYFTIHIIVVKVFDTENPKNSISCADKEYIEEFKKNQFSNIVAFYNLNKIFCKLGLKVPIYYLEFDQKYIKNLCSKDLTEKLQKEFNKQESILSKYIIKTEKEKDIYTILGENEYKLIIRNKNNDIIYNKIDISSENYYNSLFGCNNNLSFILDSIITTDYNDDSISNFISDELLELYKRLIHYKEIYGILFRMVIDNVDYLEVIEIEKDFLNKVKDIVAHIRNTFKQIK